MSKKPETYVVLGIFYGGTSAVAGALRILGVDMGSEERDHQHEDQVMSKYQLNMDAWKQRIQDRNAEGKTWGFKQPNTVRFFDELEPYLINPKYVLVYRDKKAIADSEEKYIGLDRQKSYDRTDWWYAQMKNIEDSDRETISFQYEDLIEPTKQREQAEELYAFVKGNYPRSKRNKTVRKIQKFWNQNEYISLEDL